MTIKMVTFKNMSQNDKPTNCRYLGSAHSASTVKYICQTSALLWYGNKNLKIVIKSLL